MQYCEVCQPQATDDLVCAVLQIENLHHWHCGRPTKTRMQRIDSDSEDVFHDDLNLSALSGDFEGVGSQGGAAAKRSVSMSLLTVGLVTKGVEPGRWSPIVTQRC